MDFLEPENYLQLFYTNNYNELIEVELVKGVPTDRDYLAWDGERLHSVEVKDYGTEDDEERILTDKYGKVIKRTF